MTETKHTPGPWELTPCWDVIATNRNTPDDNGLICSMCDDRHDAEGEANARLVVAAPKLLEALQSARNMLAVYGRDTDSLHVALMENIDAVITDALPAQGSN